MNCRTVPALLVSVLLASAGCTSPPSVAPLLAVAQRAAHDEAQRLRDDAGRADRAADQTRLSLADAYEADLRSRGALDPAWVLEATAVYVAAREALLEGTLRQEASYRRRADNLDAAAEAIDRARRMLDRRDELINDAVVSRVWRVLGGDAEGARHD